MTDPDRPLILVTGAGGFIGRALCQTLLQSGFRVRGVTRHPEALPPGTEATAVGEIGEKTDWSVALHGVRCIVHLAARVHVMQETADDPAKAFFDVNTAGTERLARQAVVAGARRVVYLSTIKVNGECTTTRAFCEDDIPAPQDHYSMSKWAAEQALQAVSRESGLETVLIRPPLVYGPGVRGNFLRLMRLIQTGLPLPLGALHNRRSLIYLENLTSLLAVCTHHPAAAGCTFLVSDGEDISTSQLIRRLARAMGKPARLLPFPETMLCTAGRILGRQNEIARLTDSLQVNSNALRQRLQWTPPYTLEQGLAASAAWFKQTWSGRIPQ